MGSHNNLLINKGAPLSSVAGVDSKQLAISSAAIGLNESTGLVASARNDDQSIGGKG